MWSDLSSAPRDGTLVKLRLAADPTRTVKASWNGKKWRYERRDGVVVLTTDAHYDAWSMA